MKLTLAPQVFLEFEDSPWRQRSWVQVYGEEVQAALMENTIVWAPVSDSSIPAAGGTSPSHWPALVSVQLCLLLNAAEHLFSEVAWLVHWFSETQRIELLDLISNFKMFAGKV